MKFSKAGTAFRKWSRIIHRDLSFFFSGMVLIYAISGIVMNHRNTINPNYSVERQEYTITKVMPPQAGMKKDDVLELLAPLGEGNAGKKKEEALSLLKKWFPQMENFSGQLKKYKVTINDLLAENEKLEARAKASEKGKMKDTMERAKLESELKDIQRLVDRIPPEVLAELKRQQRHTRER